MGSVLGVAVVRSVAASVFTSRLASHRLPTASVRQAVAAAHHAGRHRHEHDHAIASESSPRRRDYGVLAAAAVTLAGVAVAIATLRPRGGREQA